MNMKEHILAAMREQFDRWEELLASLPYQNGSFDGGARFLARRWGKSPQRVPIPVCNRTSREALKTFSKIVLR